MDEEEGEKFWTKSKIILVAAFVIGIAIGAAVMNQVVDPILFEQQASDTNSLLELNERLDSRNDELYQCLLNNAIDAETC